jgi:hypothetical protein
MAVPQVTAAAVLVKSLGSPQLTPALIKARLIYTSDYVSDYILHKQVWGGRLNVQRAITEPQASPGEFILTPAARINTGRLKVDLDQDQDKAFVDTNGTGEPYDPNAKQKQLPAQISVSRILRLSKTDDSFWIVYLDTEGVMRMIVNSHPRGVLKCSRVREWDPSTNSYKDVPDSPYLAGINISEIMDLVGPIPGSVTMP